MFLNKLLVLGTKADLWQTAKHMIEFERERRDASGEYKYRRITWKSIVMTLLVMAFVAYFNSDVPRERNGNNSSNGKFYVQGVRVDQVFGRMKNNKTSAAHANPFVNQSSE